MKRWKPLFYVLLSLAVILFSVVVVAYRYQNTILDKVLEEVNGMQAGKYRIEGSHIEFIKTFPYISIDLEGLAFYADDKPESSPIYQFEDVYVGFGFWELLQGKVSVKKILIENGKIDIVHHQDGSWNITNAKASTSATADTAKSEGMGMEFNLKQVTFKNISIQKKDYFNEQYVKIDISALEAGLNLATDSLTSHLESTLTLAVLESGGSKIFQNKHLALHFDLSYDFEKQFLHLYKSNFEIEEAAFSLEGDMDFANDLDLDLRVFGRKPDFKLLFSLAPNNVYEKLKDYRNAGEVYFTGRIMGKAANGNSPRIDLEFGCQNAYFVQPEKNKRLDDLNFKGYYTNGADRNLKTSELQIENLQGKPEEGIFIGTFKMKNFEQPEILLDLEADLDLRDLGDFLDLEGFPQVSGQLLIDMTVDEVFSFESSNNVVKKLKDTLYAKVVMQDLNFKLDAYPHPLEKISGEVIWNGGNLTLAGFEGQTANNDWQLCGSLNGLSNLIHGEDASVTARIDLKSGRLDFKQLLAYDSALAAQTDEVLTDLRLVAHFNTSVGQILNFTHLPQGEFFIDTLSGKMSSYAHSLQNFHADLLIGEEKLTLKDLSGKIDASDLLLTAEVNNYPALFDTLKLDQTIDWKLHFASELLKLGDLFTYKGKNPMPKEYQQEQIEDFSLNIRGSGTNGGLLHPKGLPQLAIEIEELNGKFTFHKMPFRDFHADMRLEGHDLHINELKGKIGRSDLYLSGLLQQIDAEEIGQISGGLKLNSSVLDLDELMAYSEEEEQAKKEEYGASYHDSTENLFAVPFPQINFEIDAGHIDYHKYKLDEVKAKGRTTANHYVYLDTLQMHTAGGNVGLKGYFNGSNPDSIYAKSDLYLDGIEIDQISYKMDNFGTDYSFNESMHGKVSGKINSIVRMHADFTPYLENSEAHLEITVRDGRLEKFPPMDLMADYFGEKSVRNIRFGELTNTMDFKDNALSIPKMEINSTLGYINVSGKQHMDLNMEYYLQIPFKIVGKAVKNSIFGTKEKDVENQEIQYNDGSNRMFLNVKVTGTPEDYKIELKKDKQKRKKGV